MNTIKNRCYSLPGWGNNTHNFGLLQQESGEIELSIKYFVWALISNPKGSKFMRSFLALIVQLQEVSPKLWEHFLRLQHLNKKNLSIEIHCLELISFVLRGKLDLLKNRTRAIKKKDQDSRI